MAPSHPHPSGATASGAQLFILFGIARVKVSRPPDSNPSTLILPLLLSSLNHHLPPPPDHHFHHLPHLRLGSRWR